MFGINGAEFLVIAVVALLVIGPERLPKYAAQLGRMVREARRMASGAREQVRAEMGPEFDDVDWRKLDPRQFDPRRIVREALLEDEHPPARPSMTKPARTTKPAVRPGATPGGFAKRPGQQTSGPAPFDSEST